MFIIRNNLYLETKNFTKEDQEGYSKFGLAYECKDDGDYYFNITLVDNFFPIGLFLFGYEIQLNASISPAPPPPPSPIHLPIEVNGIILAIIALVITVITVSLMIKYGRIIKDKIRKGENRDVLEKAERITPKNKDSEKKRRRTHIDFEDWD